MIVFGRNSARDSSDDPILVEFANPQSIQLNQDSAAGAVVQYGASLVQQVSKVKLIEARKPLSAVEQADILAQYALSSHQATVTQGIIVEYAIDGEVVNRTKGHMIEYKLAEDEATPIAPEHGVVIELESSVIQQQLGTAKQGIMFEYSR
ncbi:hypothetical protein [Shewanella marina]|uniref:hypothetical protein n=1 Tax=Shewanella marina TaxID=487319 RepID=UPI000470A6CC|nr:hypothetical protein [Shewanella marina]